jgi:hypothetical protein
VKSNFLFPPRCGAGNLLNNSLMENVDLITSKGHFIGAVLIFALIKGEESGINIIINIDVS